MHLARGTSLSAGWADPEGTYGVDGRIRAYLHDPAATAIAHVDPMFRSIITTGAWSFLCQGVRNDKTVSPRTTTRTTEHLKRPLKPLSARPSSNARRLPEALSCLETHSRALSAYRSCPKWAMI